MAELGKLTAVFDADTRKFDSGVRGVHTKLSLVKSELQAITTSANPAVSSLTNVSSRLGIIAGVSVIAASAIGGVVTDLASLVKSSAQAGGELFDLSQKTGFVVETLSGLSIVAKTTGSDIQAISGSLIIFQKNMEAAGDSTSKQGELFKRLNIDTRDNEKALRQVFTVLGKYKEGSQQTALATQFFGRSGAAVLAMIKETNGNLDEAIKKYDKMGLIISHGAAAASDRFNDVLEETTLQLSAVTRSIGMELLPVATEALQSISFWLAENKGAWSSWGTTVSDVLRGVKSIAESEIGQMIGFIYSNISALGSLKLIAGGLASLGQAERPQEDFYGPGGAARGGRRSLPGTPEYLAMQRRLSGTATTLTGGGGGGRGGGGSARTDPAVSFLKQLEDQYRSLTPQTELQKVQQKLLNDEYAKSSDAIKRKIMVTAIEIDQQTKILGLTRERIATGIEEREEFQKMVDLVREAGEKGGPFFSRPRTMNDLTGLLGTGASRPRSIADSATRPRIATAEAQVMRERMAMIHEQMMDLGQDLTGIFAQSIGDGFEQGAKRGLVSLAQGLLDIVQNVFLKRLAEGLGSLLSGAASGGGGGFWSGLFKAVIGAAVGGAAGGIVNLGGGSTFTPGGTGTIRPRIVGGRASGGPISAGNIYRVHKDEVIMPLRDSMVYNKSQQGTQVVNNYTINLPPSPKGGYTSPKSQRELGDKLLAMLQGSQA